MTKFEALYNGKKLLIIGKDLWDAKKQAIANWKIPKSKEWQIVVHSIESKEKEDFKFL